jgi:hypothetical protein
MSSPAADDATRRAGTILTIDLAAIAAIEFDNLPAERAGLRVTACIASAFARPPERALDRTEQCCGVCLPILMQGSSASMFCHRIRSTSAPRGRRPAVVSLAGESRKLAAPSSGTQELPIAIGRTDAMLCRPAAGHGGSAIRRSAGPVAGIAEIHRASRANADARCAQFHSGTCEGVALTALTPCMHCCHSLWQG